MISSHDDNAAKRLMDRFAGWFGYLFFICVGFVGFEVIARYIFNSPTIWVHELTVMLVGINFAIGGIFVLYDKAHIAITIVYDLSSEPKRRLLDVLVGLVSTGYLTILTYASWVVAAQAFRLGERSGTAWNPPLPMVLKGALLASVLLMAVISALQLYEAVCRLRRARS